MSAAVRHASCSACGHPFIPGEPFEVELMVIGDWPIEGIPVCPGCSTYPIPGSTARSGTAEHPPGG